MDNGAPIDDSLLHRHADGELAPAEAAEVDALLAESEALRAQYADILRLREMMGAAGEEMASGLDSEALFAAIEQGIAAGEGESAVTPAAEAPERGGLGQLWDAFVGGRAWMPAAGMVAAVGAVLLTIYAPTDPAVVLTGANGASEATKAATPTEQAEAPAEDDPQPLAEAADGAEANTTETHSEVVQVDFGQSAGTVFAVTLDDGSSTPVIWINDDE